METAENSGLRVGKMTPRERVLAALRREIPDRVPWIEGTIGNGIASAVCGEPINVDWSVAPVGFHRERGADLAEEQKKVNRVFGKDSVQFSAFAPIFAHKMTKSDDGSPVLVGDGMIGSREDFARLFKLPPPDDSGLVESAREFIAHKGDYCAAVCIRLGIGSTLLSIGMEAFSYAMVDDPGLIVLPTHRVIRGLKGFGLAALIDATRGVMEWTDAAPAEADLLDAGPWLSGFGVHAMAFAAGDRVAVGRLTDPAAMQRVAADEIPAWRELDVAILHRLVIDDVLGAGDAAIDYLADGAAALAEARDGSADLVVLMQGTPLAAVSEIALAGCVMPHKSTYFYPKLATGMVLQPLM